MNEQEQEKYEAELRRASPARAPEHFMAQLRSAKPGAQPMRPQRHQPDIGGQGWWRGWRWLPPAMAVAVVVLLVGRANFHPGTKTAKKAPSVTTGLKADDVRVDHELVSSFDVVAKLPSGEPVRFRCQKWRDQWSVTDTNLGVAIVQHNPRVEVVPVRFETY